VYKGVKVVSRRGNGGVELWKVRRKKDKKRERKSNSKQAKAPTDNADSES